MNINDGLIDNWAKEAIQDLSEKGWRDIDPNSMMLIIYTVQRTRDKKLVSKITKPIWWLFGAVGTGIVWWVINGILGMG